jgi:hypothetical protein
MINAPRTGTCYCGCGKQTKGHFAPGHDARADSMLYHLLGDRKFVSTAELVLLADYGPGGRNLTEAAEAAGWTSRENRA